MENHFRSPSHCFIIDLLGSDARVDNCMWICFFFYAADKGEIKFSVAPFAKSIHLVIFPLMLLRPNDHSLARSLFHLKFLESGFKKSHVLSLTALLLVSSLFFISPLIHSTLAPPFTARSPAFAGASFKAFHSTPLRPPTPPRHHSLLDALASIISAKMRCGDTRNHLTKRRLGVR